MADDPGICDEDLVRLARDGDPVAFRLLVERHQPMVRARAAALCANASDVDDIMQEAFLRAFIALDRLREPDRFAGWLAGIVLNVCRGLRRRDPVTLLPDSPEPPAATAFPVPPAYEQPSADDLDRADALREAMATLPAGQRRAVFLHYYAGLPAAQIGDQAGAARVSLHKARRRLREYLTEHRPDLVPRRLMTTVRIASAEHQRRRVHQTRSPSHLVVLTDDAGGRELPIWILRGDGDRLERLIHAERAETSAPARTADDLTSRMLRAIGASVTGVDIDELGPEVTAARIAVNGPAGPRQVTAGLADGLAVAITTGAPVRVADAVMDRLAVPAGEASRASGADGTEGDKEVKGVGGSREVEGARGVDGARGARRPRPRYRPRNMTFGEGLEGWLFGGSFTEHASESHWHDYACAVEDGTAVVRSTAPEPAGFAFLGQEVFADDFLGATVVFRAEFRVQVDTPGRAGLFLRVNEGHSITGPMTERSVFGDPDNNITPVPDAGDWTRHEVTARVPGDSDAIVLGVFLAAGGRIELRNPELIRRP